MVMLMQNWLIFFDKYPSFKWSDYSVPINDPIHTRGTDRELYEAIKGKIQLVNCVVIMAGVYSSYSKWINKEIEISKQIFDKPIIAVEPWDSERTSILVKENADVVVKWNSASIISAIRDYSL